MQIGCALGVSVTRVCGGAGAPLVRQLGARVLDYTTGELARTPERFDAILDTVFTPHWDALTRLLDSRGRYITTGFSLRFAILAAVGRLWSRQRFGFVLSRADGRLMRRVTEFVARGQLVPVIDSTFPLDRISDAHRRMESGHAHGKIVIVMP